MTRPVNWILDADVRSFFDSVDHEWLLRIVSHRIADRRILRLIRRWLRAGVMEGGEWKEMDKGTPQGTTSSTCGSISGVSAMHSAPSSSCGTAMVCRNSSWISG
jgi:retron-type reverse transcriptase